MLLKFRPFLLALFSCIIVLFLSGKSVSQSPSAQQLNQEGFVFLYNGEATEALSTWQQAEELYRDTNDLEGVTGTQLNQSLAEQALGLYPRACQNVARAIALPDDICETNRGAEAVSRALSSVDPTAINRIGIRLLGENLRLLGNLSEAASALAFVQPSENLVEADRVSLELGNVHYLLAKEAIETYQRTSFREAMIRSEIESQIDQQIEQASNHYLAAARSADAEISVKAHLNLIDLWVNSDSMALEVPQNRTLYSDAQTAYSALMLEGFDSLPMIDRIYSRLNLARNLIAVLPSEPPQEEADNFLDLSAINKLVSEAIALAESLNNVRALSFAYGTAGDLKVQQANSLIAAESEYTQALSLAQSVQAFDIAYEWAYKLAQLSESVGRDLEATRFYDSAIEALTQIREDLIAVNSELRFNFSDKVEPVYRDYLKFLVTGADADFSRAIKVHESLQLAQLENFLRCGRLISSDSSNQSEATIHIFNLDETVEVIVSRGVEVYGYSTPAADVLQAAENLKLNLQSPAFVEVPEDDFLPYANVLYDRLIKPAIEAEYISSAEPLSFVLDSPFQTIPMGILHDGQQYLAETHLLSNLILLQQPSSPATSSRALFAGLSELAPSFNKPLAPSGISPLPETDFEAASLTRYLRSKLLLNQEFTVAQLEQEMAAQDYRIVHISTHGQFSSVPEQTFLAAWDDLMDIRKMTQIFRGAKSIDLLVLSACQTAAGDDRAALGLAGLAVQSGAKSAIASLWLVDSTGSSVLMDRFYEGLKQGLNQAEALQQAQVTLLQSSAFSHPFYWAPFILVEG
jgi:CHAT domain-containing protein